MSKHIKMTALSKANGKWYAMLQAINWWGRKNNIIASGQLSSDGSVFTSNCSVISDKPIDVELVKNAIFQQWRVFG